MQCWELQLSWRWWALRMSRVLIWDGILPSPSGAEGTPQPPRWGQVQSRRRCPWCLVMPGQEWCIGMWWCSWRGLTAPLQVPVLSSGAQMSLALTLCSSSVLSSSPSLWSDGEGASGLLQEAYLCLFPPLCGTSSPGPRVFSLWYHLSLANCSPTLGHPTCKIN